MEKLTCEKTRAAYLLSDELFVAHSLRIICSTVRWTSVSMTRKSMTQTNMSCVPPSRSLSGAWTF